MKMASRCEPLNNQREGYANGRASGETLGGVCGKIDNLT